MKTKLFLSALLLTGAVSLVSAAPTLTVGSTSGQAGTTVTLPIQFNPGGSSVASLQFNLTLPANLSTVSVTAGTMLTSIQKSVTASLAGTTWKFIVFGVNQTAIPAGTLMTVQLKIASGATGALSLPVSGAIYSDANGQSITAGANTAGSVTVTTNPIPPPPPSITSALTASGQVGVAFNYQITAINSPTSFGATNLLPGLTFTAATGRISGTPTGSGNGNITITATNAAGSDTKTLAVTIIPAAVPTAPTLSAGTVSGPAGTTVNVPVNFTASAQAVVAMQFKMTLPTGITPVSMTTGPDVTGSIVPGSILAPVQKQVGASFSGNTLTFLIYGLNTNAIPSGEMLTVKLKIDANVQPGTAALPLPLSGVTYTDANAQPVNPGSITDGSITVTAGGLLETPLLNLRDGDFVALNSQISASYGGTVPAVTYEWSFTPISDVLSMQSHVAHAGAGGSVASYTTSSPRANLGSISNLVAGPYLISVRVLDSNGNPSPSASASVTLVSGDLSGVRAYPNPWRSDKHASKPYITFDNLTVNTHIKIFTVSGHSVKALPTSNTVATWDLKNDSDDNVASGIYLYLMTTDQGQKKTGQIIIIR